MLVNLRQPIQLEEGVEDGVLLATLTFLLVGSTGLILFLQTPSSHSYHQYVGILRAGQNHSKSDVLLHQRRFCRDL